MQLAFYRGKSWVSKMIRLFTRGPYSHVALVVRPDMIVEAWHNPPRVRVIKDLSDGHEAGTRVDLFDFEPPFPGAGLIHLKSSLGKRYDFRGVLGFITKADKDDRKRCFCSELLMEYSIAAGLPLLERVKPFKVSPSMAAMSPLLKYRGSITTKKYKGPDLTT